ncbi:MAG: type IV pili twitching motility protein PilT, partial [Halobacteriovoraceae bacterium]|nr:type IV pili twitching motility protein PilT [Halobacteriovoraceae bacterium]
PGRVCAMEIMRTSPAIRNLIREDKIHQVYSQMQIGQEKTGMLTMNQSLKRFVENGVLDGDTAMAYSTEPEELGKQLGIKVRSV